MRPFYPCLTRDAGWSAPGARRPARAPPVGGRTDQRPAVGQADRRAGGGRAAVVAMAASVRWLLAAGLAAAVAAEFPDLTLVLQPDEELDWNQITRWMEQVSSDRPRQAHQHRQRGYIANS